MMRRSERARVGLALAGVMLCLTTAAGWNGASSPHPPSSKAVVMPHSDGNPWSTVVALSARLKNWIKTGG